jgi:hypothetical protein
METFEIVKVALATVGMTEVIKNFIQKGGKKIWTLVALFVGALMVCIKLFCPEEVITGIVAVSGAVIFYDTIYKAFEKLFAKLGKESND